MRTRAIASAKVKTDKVDAQGPGSARRGGLLARGVGARSGHARVAATDRAPLQPGGQRTRLRNQIHAVLARNLIEAPFSDVFGQGGRRWLDEVRLPEHEREQVDSDLRLHDALNSEIELVERQLAEQALAPPRGAATDDDPGVGAITALALIAVIGDVARFPNAAAPGRVSGPGPAGAPIR